MSEKPKLIFVTGGRRSGKSKWALGKGALLGNRRLFIATANGDDEEMTQRIRIHQSERGSDWVTKEEGEALEEALTQGFEYDVCLVDCMTLWLTNLVCKYNLTDRQIMERLEKLEAVCRNRSSHLMFISNEIGLGVVPATPLSRRFSDLAGLMNQRLAHLADDVILSISGIPIAIKGEL